MFESFASCTPNADEINFIGISVSLVGPFFVSTFNSAQSFKTKSLVQTAINITSWRIINTKCDHGNDLCQIF